MPGDRRRLASLLLVAGTRLFAQSAADGPVLGAHRLLPSAGIKVWVPAGRLRLVAWDRDSIVVRGHAARGESFFFGGDTTGMKFGVDTESEGNSARTVLIAYIPRRCKVSMKTVSANLDANNVSGWFYSVSGAMHFSGRASSIEAETMTGSLDLDVVTPWIRARTGDGHLLVRGAPEDVDASTIAGTLDIAATSMLRGQFGSVSGDIHYAGSPARSAIFEFSSHSGSIDLVLPSNASGVFALSSIAGRVENAFGPVQPASSPRSLRVSLGRGEAQIAVRTFKGAIRLRRH